MTEDPLVAHLRARLLSTLTSVLPAGRDVALVDFPNHSNVGDSAIWLGEMAALHTLGRRVRYVCDVATYDRRALTRAVPSGPILIHGGGNLGDLYPDHQELREQVVEDFPERHVIQLPQSVHFDGEGAVEQARSILSAHPKLTVLARDRGSLDFVRNRLAAHAVLCPDAAIAAPRNGAGRSADRPWVWLARTDSESSDRHRPPTEVESVDWLVEPEGMLERSVVILRRIARQEPRVRALVGRVAAPLWARLATRRVARGLDQIGRGAVVVTDRLHGHLLALQMGIPHVVLDTAQGKVGRYVSTWTADSPLVHQAADGAEALAAARRLASGGVHAREA